MIRANHGLVTAEQLAPFLTPCPSPPTATTSATDTDTAMTSSSTVVEESYVLPLVMRFQGIPVVSNDGHILYAFQVQYHTIPYHTI